MIGTINKLERNIVYEKIQPPLSEFNAAPQYFTIHVGDTVETASRRAKDCLQQSGFLVTADGNLRPDPEALHQFREHLINLCAHARQNNGRPTLEGRVQATWQAARLLATWGLMDGSRLCNAEKMALLAGMRFGKGGKSTRYGDARWSAPAREEALLADFGFERDVPASLQHFVAFLLAHGLSGSLHRKPVTIGCQEAVKYRVRSSTGERGVSLREEVKTVLLKGRVGDTDTPMFLALHLPAHQYVDMRRVQQALSTNNLGALVFPDTQRLDPEVARDLGLISGRLNKISIGIAAQERSLLLTHICDETLISGSPMRVYTNAGLNTWGIELFDVKQLLRIPQVRPTQRRPTDRPISVQPIIIAPITQLG
jgi:hypothetical protein